MFRAAVLSIVLTMAAGPTASLLCAGWCHPHEPATTGCHHPAAAMRANLRGEASCNHVVLGTISRTRDEARRWTTPSGVVLAVVAPAVVMTLVDAHHVRGSDADSPPRAARPRLTTLRI